MLVNSNFPKDTTFSLFISLPTKTYQVFKENTKKKVILQFSFNFFSSSSAH